MVDADKKQFADAVKEVLRVYNQEVTTFQLRVWWIGLEKFEVDNVLNALGAYMAIPEKCKFAPKPGDIVELIKGSGKDREALAMQAWQMMTDNLNSYATSVFPHPAIHYAIAMTFGTWIRAGQMTEKEEPFKRRDFIKAFCQYEHGMEYPGRLVGITEQENFASGYENPLHAVAYIGDKQKCLEVEKEGNEKSLGIGLTKLEGITHE